MGFVLALVFISHVPDGMLFTVTASVLLIVLFARKKQSISTSILKSVELLLLASVVLGVPYLIWKNSYYGDGANASSPKYFTANYTQPAQAR